MMRDELIELFKEAISEMNPYDAVTSVFRNGSIDLDTDTISLRDFEQVYVLALGKASVAMARAVLDCSELTPSNALIVCPIGTDSANLEGAHVIEAEHPVPGKNSERAGREVAQFVKDIPGNALFICCISGGTSSLVARPASGISLNDLNKAHELLLNSGADIYQMNTVRKHLSQIKGGQLLRHLNSGVVLVNLIISDVPGDDPEIIGSGPTVPDSSTFADAHQVLKFFKLWDKVSESVRTHIKKGLAGNVPETLKPGEMAGEKHFARIVSSADMLAGKVGELGKDAGFRVHVAEEAYNEEVEIVASGIAREAKEIVDGKEFDETPRMLIYYGESKVNITGNGKGGRNQELALRGALKIQDYDTSITWLSIGTDGIDGPTDAAGAVVDGNTIAEARKKGIEPEDYLERNDSYHFHEKMGTLVKIGPTGNNLMDLQIVLINYH